MSKRRERKKGGARSDGHGGRKCHRPLKGGRLIHGEEAARLVPWPPKKGPHEKKKGIEGFSHYRWGGKAGLLADAHGGEKKGRAALLTYVFGKKKREKGDQFFMGNRLRVLPREERGVP